MSGNCSYTAAIFCSQSPVRIRSLLRITTNSPRACVAPRLQLARKPRLDAFRINLIPDTARSASAADCGEQSSIMSTSMARPLQVSTMLLRQVKVNRCWSKTGMISEYFGDADDSITSGTIALSMPYVAATIG